MGTGPEDDEYGLGRLFDRGLGAAQIISNHTLSPFSEAGLQAADNLLAKARRRFASGDDARAIALIERAAALPYDTHEEAAPAAIAARMMLFNAITDEAEEAAESDSRWLDAALQILETSDESARCELRDVLLAIRQDYALTKQEERAIDLATRGVPARAQLQDMGPLPAEELSPHLVAIVRATVGYAAALARGEPDDE